MVDVVRLLGLEWKGISLQYWTLRESKLESQIAPRYLPVQRKPNLDSAGTAPQKNR